MLRRCADTDDARVESIRSRRERGGGGKRARSLSVSLSVCLSLSLGQSPTRASISRSRLSRRFLASFASSSPRRDRCADAVCARVQLACGIERLSTLPLFLSRRRSLEVLSADSRLRLRPAALARLRTTERRYSTPDRRPPWSASLRPRSAVSATSCRARERRIPSPSGPFIARTQGSTSLPFLALSLAATLQEILPRERVCTVAACRTEIVLNAVS